MIAILRVTTYSNASGHHRTFMGNADLTLEVWGQLYIYIIYIYQDSSVQDNDCGNASAGYVYCVHLEVKLVFWTMILHSSIIVKQTLQL